MDEEKNKPQDTSQNQAEAPNPDVIFPAQPKPQPVNTTPPSDDLDTPDQEPKSHEPSQASHAVVPDTTTQPRTDQPPSVGSSFDYNSNPFVAVGRGLGAALTTNVIPTLVIGLIPLIALFGFIPISIIIGALVGPIGGLLIMLVGFIALIILFLRASAGSIIIVLESINDRKITTREAIGKMSSHRLTSYFFTIFLVGLFVLLGLIVFIVPGIILIGKLALAPIVVYAEDLKTMDAIKRSMQLTKGHTFEMLGVLIAQGIMTFNGPLAFVGYNSGVARRYYEIAAAEKVGNAKPEKTHWLNFASVALVVLIVMPYISLIIFAASQSPNSSTNYDYSDFYDDSLYDTDYDYNSIYESTLE